MAPTLEKKRRKKRMNEAVALSSSTWTPRGGFSAVGQGKGNRTGKYKTASERNTHKKPGMYTEEDQWARLDTEER